MYYIKNECRICCACGIQTRNLHFGILCLHGSFNDLLIRCFLAVPCRLVDPSGPSVPSLHYFRAHRLVREHLLIQGYLWVLLHRRRPEVLLAPADLLRLVVPVVLRNERQCYITECLSVETYVRIYDVQRKV